MAKVILTDGSLEQAKTNSEKASNEASAIASKIQSVTSSLDPRVKSRVSGLQGLSSFFETTTTNLTTFANNIDNTIYYLKSLEEQQGNISFTDKLFLQESGYFQISSALDQIENVSEMMVELFSKYLPEEEMAKIKTSNKLDKNDSLYYLKKLYDWLPNIARGGIFKNFHKKDENRFSANVIPVVAGILKGLVDEDCERSNAQYPKEIAVVYGNVAVNNPIVHFGYWQDGKIITANGFEGLLTGGKADCIGFVKWCYYQALKDVYGDNPEKMELIKRNLTEMQIGGKEEYALIEPLFTGDTKGSYEVEGKTSEVELIVDMLEPGDVIATDITQGHVRLVKSVDRENKTFTTMESTLKHGFYESELPIERSLIAWAKNGGRVTIIKGDKITSYLTGDEVNEIVCKKYNGDESSIDPQIISNIFLQTGSNIEEVVFEEIPNNPPISTGKIEGRFIDKFQTDQPEPQIVHKTSGDYFMRDNLKK